MAKQLKKYSVTKDPKATLIKMLEVDVLPIMNTVSYPFLVLYVCETVYSAMEKDAENYSNQLAWLFKAKDMPALQRKVLDLYYNLLGLRLASYRA